MLSIIFFIFAILGCSYVSSLMPILFFVILGFLSASLPMEEQNIFGIILLIALVILYIHSKNNQL